MQAFIKYVDGKFAWLSNETFGMISGHCDHGDALIRSFKNGRKKFGSANFVSSVIFSDQKK